MPMVEMEPRLNKDDMLMRMEAAEHNCSNGDVNTSDDYDDDDETDSHWNWSTNGSTPMMILMTTK